MGEEPRIPPSAPRPGVQRRGRARAAPRSAVLVVGRTVILREALTELFQGQSDMWVVGQAVGREALLASVAEVRPDVVVWEPCRADGSMSGTLGAIGTLAPGAGVVVLAPRGVRPDADAPQGPGRHIVLPPDAGWSTLLAAVRSLRPGAAGAPSGPSAPVLSRREMQVLNGVAKAMTNQQIARGLGIMPGTVKRHLHAVFRKLGAVSRLDAVAQAQAAGLLTLPTLGEGAAVAVPDEGVRFLQRG